MVMIVRGLIHLCSLSYLLCYRNRDFLSFLEFFRLSPSLPWCFFFSRTLIMYGKNSPDISYLNITMEKKCIAVIFLDWIVTFPKRHMSKKPKRQIAISYSFNLLCLNACQLISFFLHLNIFIRSGCNQSISQSKDMERIESTQISE